ncbi:MAG TPA: 4,5-DOPA dioxygenase extradiol [Prolixibacteraceae bacterium]|nr:4,5-DOPA dioxygenase extradiol [Prolixibacteraceae bacterium]
MKVNDLNKMATSFNSTAPMPVLFIGHGSPMNAIVENEFVDTWRKLGKTLPRPNAILVISAHWETRGTMVTAMEKPTTIHDFGGFPKALFEVQYPAPGSPDLALEVQKTVKKTLVGLDEKWGLDHGAWSVVNRLYPNADIPVIQMSLDYYQTPHYHYELAKELTFLRHKGVLIIGSGNMVHNLRMVAWDRLNDSEYGYDWAIEANEKMKSFILNNDHQQMINFSTRGRAFDLAIPSPEHFLPSLYALALKDENENITLFNDKAIGGSLTMTSFQIGGA